MSDDWFSAPILSDAGLLGSPARLRLEPLTRVHAEAFLAAAVDHSDQVFAHLMYDPPRTVDEAATIIDRLKASADQIPYAQIVADTGEFAGTSSFYEINPAHRALAIGSTWIGYRWWRSWLNTTSKLIMLCRAFDELGAERVVWHTDIRNIRSRQAIARLGATREGVLRHHRIRRDGSWRDTVIFSMLAGEWPAARDALTNRLTREGPIVNATERELTFARHEAGSRYTAMLGGSLVGLIDYSERPGSVVFLHTETDPAFQGRGFAGRLTSYALDDVRERGLTVVPLCSYTQRFLTQNPHYADLVAEPS